MNVIRECLFSMRKKTKTELKFCINALLIDTLKQKLIVKREASERCQTLFTIKQTPLSGRVIRTPRGCIQIQNVGLNFRIPRNSFPPHLHVSGGFEDRGLTQ